MMKTRFPGSPALLVALLVAAGCTSTGGAPVLPPVTGASGASLVASIRAAGQAADDELDVRPLRDPYVEDLRRRAAEFEQEGDVPRAAVALDQALALQSADPAVLQERAEVAVLLGDLGGAERHARQAIAVGAGVGPLCRRHWATIEAVAGSRVDAADAAAAAQARTDRDSARRQREACTVAAPPRY